MRRKRDALIPEDESAFEISSLVDVSFLLLIYFLVVNTIMPQEKDLPMTLPSPSGAAPADLISLRIEVKDDESIVMNAGGEDELLDLASTMGDIPITRDRLHTMNAMALSAGSELVVQMKISESASHQRFIDVLNCLRGENINKFTLLDSEEEL